MIPPFAIACVLFFGPMIGLSPSGLSGAMAGILGMCLLFVLLFLGMPIGFGMAITGFLGMVYIALLPYLSRNGLVSAPSWQVNVGSPSS